MKSTWSEARYNAVYHVFCFLINGTWYRSGMVYDDDEFDGLMDMLCWRLPYNMKVFHFTSEELPPVSKNPVFLSRPVINVDERDLFEKRIGVKLKRAENEMIAVQHHCGNLMIVKTDDEYSRLLRCSEGDLIFAEFYPIPLSDARLFVTANHRHCSAPHTHKFSIGLLSFGKLIGVIIASTPRARALDDGFTLELIRCCVLPEQWNACSKLYARAIQTGKGMGFNRIVTYTLLEESGSSLKAVGFKLDGVTQARPHGWDHPSRPRKMPPKYPTGPKCRWMIFV